MLSAGPIGFQVQNLVSNQTGVADFQDATPEPGTWLLAATALLPILRRVRRA